MARELHDKHRGRIIILFILPILYLLLLKRVYVTQDSISEYPKAYQDILLHQKESEIDKEDMQSLADLIQETEEKVTSCQQEKKRLDSLRTQEQEAEKQMYEAMDHAIYVGKFVCKVNTCQGDRKDKNYPVFINATKSLTDAKQKLADAKQSYQRAKKEADRLAFLEAMLQDMKETQKQLEDI